MTNENTVKIEVVENSPRYYKLGDELFPSVTTVLSFFPSEELMSWIRALGEEEARRIAAERAVIGKKIHYLVLSKYAPNLRPPSTRLSWKNDGWEDEVEWRSQLALAMWEEYVRENGVQIRPLYVETPFVTRKYGYGGTPDMVTADGILYELKTSKQPYREHQIQVGAYTLLLRQNGVRIKEGVIVYLHPFEYNNPELKARVYRFDRSTLLNYAAEFLQLLKIYKEMNMHGKAREKTW